MARKVKKRKPTPEAIAVIVDGETEKWYLEKMKEVERLNIQIKPELASRKTIDGQIKFVCEKLKEEYDKVYWVLDADTIIKEEQQKKGIIEKLKKEVVKLKEEYDNLKILINTPCLEFWFLLHFQATGKFYPQCAQIEKLLNNEKCLPNYEKTEKFYKQTNNIYARLKPNLEFAIKNAEKLGNLDFDNLEKAKAEIYLLVEYLLTLKNK